jgi:phage-related baseplate assembly protein
VATNLVSTNPSRFPVINPALLPPMKVLETINTEAIIAARMAQLKTIWTANDPPNGAAYDVDSLEFDPLKIQAQLSAYFELMLRDRVNQAARAITLAFAVGSDLDAIGSRYPYGGKRKTQDAGTWTGPGTQEPDDLYRTRLWMSPSIFSLSGPGQGTYESYVFWAMSAPMPLGVGALKHAAAFTKAGTGNIYIPILPLSTLNLTWVKGVIDRRQWVLTPGAITKPTVEQISAVYSYIVAPDQARKGLTDVINILAPKVINVAIDADLYWFPGVDVNSLITLTNKAVSDLVAGINWLGADLTRMALQGAFAQSGMYRAVIRSPLDDVLIDNSAVINITSVTLKYVGSGE